MTDQKPCLPECREYCDHITGGQPCEHPMGTHRHEHAPACKNAKPAEPPKRINHKWSYEPVERVKDGVVSTCTVCGLRLDGWPGPHRNPGCKMPTERAVPPKVLTRNQAFLRDLSKPAEPLKCDCWKHENQVCDICQGVEAEPQGEPPIDWVGAKLSAEHGMRIPLNHLNNLGRAYLALAAEVERLRVRVAELESGQPANYHGWCECYSCRKERAFKEVSHNDR